MDTPTITLYYKEQDPQKRKELLEQSIRDNEDPVNNAIREELWNIRYAEKSAATAGARADGFLALWMAMEFNRGAGHKFFGSKSSRKELMKHVEKLRFREFLEGGEEKREMLYRECVHLVKTYMELCNEDRSYNTFFSGIISMKKEVVDNKIKRDIYETAIELPTELAIEELSILKDAAKEAFEMHFPGEGGLPEVRDWK